MLNRFLHRFGPGTHQNDDALGIRRTDVIEQLVLASGQLGELVHVLLDDLRESIEPRILRFTRLEKNVRILRSAAQHRMFRRQGAATVSTDQFRRQHFLQHSIVDRSNLGNFV